MQERKNACHPNEIRFVGCKYFITHLVKK